MFGEDPVDHHGLRLRLAPSATSRDVKASFHRCRHSIGAATLLVPARKSRRVVVETDIVSEREPSMSAEEQVAILEKSYRADTLDSAVADQLDCRESVSSLERVWGLSLPSTSGREEVVPTSAHVLPFRRSQRPAVTRKHRRCSRARTGKHEQGVTSVDNGGDTIDPKDAVWLAELATELGRGSRKESSRCGKQG